MLPSSPIPGNSAGLIGETSCFTGDRFSLRFSVATTLITAASIRTSGRDKRTSDHAARSSAALSRRLLRFVRNFLHLNPARLLRLPILQMPYFSAGVVRIEAILHGVLIDPHAGSALQGQTVEFRISTKLRFVPDVALVLAPLSVVLRAKVDREIQVEHEPGCMRVRAAWRKVVIGLAEQFGRQLLAPALRFRHFFLERPSAGIAGSPQHALRGLL